MHPILQNTVFKSQDLPFWEWVTDMSTTTAFKVSPWHLWTVFATASLNGYCFHTKYFSISFCPIRTCLATLEIGVQLGDMAILLRSFWHVCVVFQRRVIKLYPDSQCFIIMIMYLTILLHLSISLLFGYLMDNLWVNPIVLWKELEDSFLLHLRHHL